MSAWQTSVVLMGRQITPMMVPLSPMVLSEVTVVQLGMVSRERLAMSRAVTVRALDKSILEKYLAPTSA